MARDRYVEESHNNERWVVSYADFITLLFAFFVVMYSISSVNEGKYKVLSNSLEAVFSDEKTQELPIIPSDYDTKKLDSTEGMKSLPIKASMSLEYKPLIPLMSPELPITSSLTQENKTSSDLLKSDESFLKIKSKLQQDLQDLISNDDIFVRANDQWIEVEIKSNILFESGQASLNSAAQLTIRKIANVLTDYHNAIQVEGFTDNVPIETNQYPSNWELSSARAAAIVRLLVDASINPNRLAAIGYGEFQPIADNATELGRNKNRRVVLLISKAAEVRKKMS